MAWGSGKKVGELEAKVSELQQWVDYLHGTEPMAVAAEVNRLKGELTELQSEVASARDAVAQARRDESVARAQLVQDVQTAELQEVGFYTFNHPLDNTLEYKDALKRLQEQMKGMIKARSAVESITHWTVNGSTAKGNAMVRDISKLMLRAYNGEADTLVRNLRPHTLDSAKLRLDKAAATIERLGKTMQIRISVPYHRLRYRELELTADYLVKKQIEKEAERERRARLRDEAKAKAELEAELVKLRKEEDHYKRLLKRIDPSDIQGAAEARAKLDEIAASIEGVEHRAANTRAGHVYVISNIGSFGPDMVKIGMTRRLNPMDRVIELGDASVPFRFDVHALVFHEDAVSLETYLHQALAERKVNRINQRREFFYATPAEVRELMHRYSGAVMLEYKDVPDALEWRASGAVRRETPSRAASDEMHQTSEDTSEMLDQPDRPRVDARAEVAVDDSSTWDPPNGDAGSKAAWYVAPDDPALWRRWDGSAWTSETKQRKG